MSRPGLTSTRKFRRLSRTLGSRLVAMGALELVWQACWDACDDHVGTAAEIEDLVGWTGTPGALVEALIDAGAPDQEGFLEQIERVNSGETTYRVHDLWDHAPDYVLKRRQRQEQRHQLLNPGDKRRRRVNRAADTRGTNGAARSTIRPTSVHVTAVQGSTRYDSTQQGKGRGAARGCGRGRRGGGVAGGGGGGGVRARGGGGVRASRPAPCTTTSRAG